MKGTPAAKRLRATKGPDSFGPIADLESHLPEDWWSQLFDALYVITDGDVVENAENTRRDVDFVIETTGIEPDMQILDLCCGQGRHSLELARRGFTHVAGIDRSRYLVRLARKRAAQANLSVSFKEGDARAPRMPEMSLDAVLIMGNSFGYFAQEEDDHKVLKQVGKILRPTGILLLDLTEGDWIREHFEPRSWEWIDKHHFVCRERSLSANRDRLISREVIVHDETGVIADQFYAERLYSRERITEILTETGFRTIRYHGAIESLSDRGQDLGMMARRMVLSATAPQRLVMPSVKKRAVAKVAVLLGDPRLPDPVKRGGKFNPEDLETVTRLKDALSEVPGYQFRFLDNHATIERDLTLESTDFAFNLCDEGWNNNAYLELHVPALLELKGIPYTGAGPSCLGACYDKALVRAIAASRDIPVPAETYVRLGDQGATLPSVFPAILKPNFGDSSVGITKGAVVHDQQNLLAYLEQLQSSFADRPILVQEFLSGDEYSVCLIGNPNQGLRSLPILEVDYSGLDPTLPRILGYESKWEPDSPYWTQIKYRQTSLAEDEQARLIDYATRLFERLDCRDYARFDFRANADGEIKLLEVNPNPGWCWDGKVNLMASFAGTRYPQLLDMILHAARDRIALGTTAMPNLTLQAPNLALQAKG